MSGKPNVTARLGRSSKSNGKVQSDRLIEAEKLLILCVPHRAIVQHMMEKFFISQQAAHEYIAAVYEAWARRPRIDKEALREKMRGTLSDLYQKCVRVGNLKTAVAVLDKMCRLDGLYAPEVSEVNLNTGVPATDPEKVRERIRSLLARHPEVLAKVPDATAIALAASGGSSPEGEGGSN